MSFNSLRLSHAYITDVSFVETLAMAVVCSARDAARPCKNCADCDKASRHIHPDIITVERLDNKLIISVDQIRALKQDVYILPNEAMQKAYIVKDADSMNTNAQNAFLQILEEPPAHTVFVLCTDNPMALLPTVRSRCVELKSISGAEVVAVGAGGAVVAVGESDDVLPEGLAELTGDFVEALTGDNVKLMECMFRIDKLDRHAFQSFLSQAREQVVLALRESSGDASSANSTDFSNFSKREALIQADEILTKAGEMLDLNVSAGHIAGFICASCVKP